MTEGYVLQVAREALYLVLLVSAPVVLASLVVGLVISLLQATTQLQDHTLTFVPKLIAVILALAAAGGWIGSQLVRFAQTLFAAIPTVR